jgi:adenylate cyclase
MAILDRMSQPDRISPTDLVGRRWLRLPPLLDRGLSIAVTPDDSLEAVRNKRLLTGALWVALPTIVLSMVQFLLLRAPIAALLLGAPFLAVVTALLVMWLRPSAFPGVLHLVVGVTVLTSMGPVLLFGGLVASGGNAIWGLIAVLGAVVIFADRRAIVWLAVYLSAAIVTAVVGTRIDPVYTLENAEFVAVRNLVVVILFVFFLLFYYVRQRAILLAESDVLLRNVLPDVIAERLKRSGERIAESFESASILFADVADFTPMSADLSPEELVDLLDEVFTVFDDLVEECGLEKIKTIGDAYMVAAGVPRPRGDHAHAICGLALSMVDTVERAEFQGRRLRFRIGINSGPVVAGIIGRKKFSYDLWGDAVNVASRMESAGTAGRIQITDNTRRLVEDSFICESSGTATIKGRGEMPVWFLVKRRT